MLKSEKLFGRRENTLTDGKPSDHVIERLIQAGGPGSAIPTGTNVSFARPVPASITAASVSSHFPSTMHAASVARSTLTVGPNIKLKGVEITDCDTLVVEGRVEATIHSRMVQILEMGIFVGCAEFDIAEIRGEFDGELTVRQKLVVHSTGRVTGKIRYATLVIEEGGQLSGDLQMISTLAS